MEHLTTLDATFLEAEESDPHVSLAVGGVSIIEGPPPDYGDLVSAFAERAQSIPRCTQVLHTHPFDLGAPEWVEDKHFDIAHHLHRVALPHPGDEAELFGMIANIMEQRLDRDRPVLDHRRAHRQSVGAADEDPPLHRRWHSHGADAGEA
jgi:diacylglycerol O-acyltransferase / wax synthase